MTHTTSESLRAWPRLEQAQIEEVRGLTDLCNRHDGLDLKINWELLATRDGDRPSDFFVHAGDVLVAYAALDGFGGAYETTGMVHPSWRRRGIFRRLFEAVRAEARARRAAEWLLVCERASTTGQSWVRAGGATYRFSEFHMKRSTEGSPPLPPTEPGFRLEQAGLAELEALVDLDAEAFGGSLDDIRRRVERDLGEAGSRIFMAWSGDVSVGKVGVLTEEAGHYLRAVAVRRDLRGRGYGRQILSAVLGMLTAEGTRRVSLDVETENDNALRLYQSCGLRTTNIYDYFAAEIGAP